MSGIGGGTWPASRVAVHGERVADSAVNWTARNEDSTPCATWLAGFFGRSRGALVCSGSMALELALLHLGVEPGWRVVVPSNSCPQVAAAVLRCGSIPIVVDTSDTLLLTGRALRCLGEPPHAVIAVHPWGLPCAVPELRQAVGSRVGIIEDAAQAWGMHTPDNDGAGIADVVVTSMGPDKPLCIDGGGAAFAHSDIAAHIDTWSPGQRQRDRPAFAVAISKYALPHISAAVGQAEARTEHLRRHVPELVCQLSDLGLAPWSGNGAPPPSWRFVPVRARDHAEFERLRFAPEAEELGVCAPASLDDLPMLRDRAVFVGASPAQGRWLLVDPLPALANPGAVERWAKRARP